VAGQRTPAGIPIPDEAIRYTFSRAGGPGGQHVNTSSTRAQVAISVDALDLSPSVDARLRARWGDTVRASASESRSQWRNRSLALKRAMAMIDAAIAVERSRVATRATKGSKERRLKAKAHRSRTKTERRRVSDD
jgi:ribosome-associated protein